MVATESGKVPARLTARGAATRERILSAAADLVYARGVGGTSLDDVMDSSGTGRSQLYHYFADKDALVAEVIARQVATQLAEQRQLLGRAASLRALRRWRNAEVVDARARRGAYGCAIGSLAGELADRSEAARTVLAEAFATWESYLRESLQRMQDKGVLVPAARPAELAAGIMAALQGGLLLAQTTRDPHQLELALDMALDHVGSFAAQPART